MVLTIIFAVACVMRAQFDHRRDAGNTAQKNIPPDLVNQTFVFQSVFFGN